MRNAVLALLVGFLFLLPAPVSAQVVATFYSHERAGNFPHAFFTLQGRTLADGKAVDTNYGFTTKVVTPAVLFGSVAGRVEQATPQYIANSDAQFSVTLTDAQYEAMLAVVTKWQTRKSPSYNLNKANCVHFVGEAAQAAGLTVAFPRALMKKPRSYLVEIRRMNAQFLLAQR